MKFEALKGAFHLAGSTAETPVTAAWQHNAICLRGRAQMQAVLDRQSLQAFDVCFQNLGSTTGSRPHQQVAALRAKRWIVNKTLQACNGSHDKMELAGPRPLRETPKTLLMQQKEKTDGSCPAPESFQDAQFGRVHHAYLLMPRRVQNQKGSCKTLGC